MNWGDLKLITLQKLFSNDTSQIIVDDTTSPYIAAMPGAANACLNYIASAVRHIIKSVEITQDGAEAGVKRYQMKELAPDFYSLDKVYYGNGLRRTYDYRFIGVDTLLLDGGTAGTFTVFYEAYPAEITADTAEDYEMPLYPEVCSLIPWFMASQLYKDDDPSLSTVYWNEFSALLEEIKNNFSDNSGYDDAFVDTKGWWS